MVTRSANDAAVVVAEAIAGDEREFAKLMTRTARALGMSNTVYRNASGLPDDDQVTTARDQATLGRAVQERFPRYYKYFSIRSFTFRGESIGNHNHLLGRVDGVDGIKTGYIRASGFNLVTSVHRGNRYLVAVVMGGGSAGSRDARMRELIQDKIAQASTKRTAPMVAEAPVAAETKPAPKIAAKPEPKPEPKSESKVASKVEPKADAKAEGKSAPRFAVASAISVPIRFKPAAAQAEPAVVHAQTTATVAGARARVVAGSTDPIRPVLVKTLTVRAGTQMASLTPLHVPPAPVADVQPARDVAHIPAAAPAVAIRSEPPAPPAVKPEPPAPPPAVAAAKPEVPATQPAPVAAETPEPPAAQPVPVAAKKAVEATPLPTARPGSVTRAAAAEPASTAKHRSGWMIQVGAYPGEQAAKQRLSNVQTKASKMLTGAEAFTETIEKGGTTYYRARFAGLDKDKAEAACKYLKKNDVECVTIKN